MKHHLPSLDALKVFEAAARHLSFSRAAEELCISKAAVSYQIRKLESELDCALFKRSVRQVFLTDGAQELLKVTQQLFSDLSATLQQIQPAQYSHDVLVGATTYVALRWLSPRMSKFTEANPGISVLLQHSVNSDDFRLHDVDLAIRWGSIDDFDKRSVLKRLPMPLFPVCSKAFLSRTLGRHDATHLEPADLAKPPLGDTPLLCEERSLDLWQAWYGKQNLALDNARRIIMDANVRTQAAIDGLGWTMADELMRRELDNHELVAPFNHQLDGYGYIIQAPPGRYCSQSVAALRDTLVSEGS